MREKVDVGHRQERTADISHRQAVTIDGRALGGAALVVLAFVLVLLACGVAPGVLPNPIDIYSGGGIATCVARDFPRHLFSCPDMGYPTQYQATTGQPVYWLTGFVKWIGLDLVNSVRTVWLVAVALSFWAARRCLARVTAVAWLAWAGVLSFMLAPIVLGQGGYGAQQIGFLLVPAYLLLDIRLAEGLARKLGGRRVVLRWAAVGVCRTVGLMIDPYSFVIASVGVVAIWLCWAWHRWRNRQIRLALIGAALVGVTYPIAYFLYAQSAQTGGFVVEHLDYFRASGIDLYVFLVPSDTVWWASLTGIHHHLGPLQGYNDGHNIYDIYLGVPLLGVALLGVIVGFRKRAAVGTTAVAAGVALVCVLLSFGPSLKIEDFRTITNSTVLTYTMPASAATLPTPWSWAYLHVPGISNMRAVWRWDLGSRLALVTLAVLGLSFWVGRCRSWRSRWVPAAVAVLIVIDSMGDIPAQLNRGHNYLVQEEAVASLVTTPLVPLVRPGERAILYGPGGVSPGANDYLANFICATVDIRCYNAGGDKALNNILTVMPALAISVVVNHVRLGDGGVEKALRKMLTAGALDVVVLVNFDLAAQASVWPPLESTRAHASAAGRKMFAGGTFERVEEPYFTVIRAKRRT